MSTMMMFLCLPDVQKTCQCDLISRLTKTDCGVVLPPQLAPAPAKKKPRR